MGDKKESSISAVTTLAATDFLRSVGGNGATGKITAQNALYQMLDNCDLDFKNSITRGKSLGTSLTSAQAAEIANGTFKGMWLDDYWSINGITWRIWGFNPFLGRGDTNVTKPHLLIMPDQALLAADGSTTHYMNETNTTEGGYAATDCRQKYLALCQTAATAGSLPTSDDGTCLWKAVNAFGSSHILKHREMISTAVSSGRASAWAWHDSYIELPSEANMYGHVAWSPYTDGGSGYNIGTAWGQFPLARLKPNRVASRLNYWLRDVVSASDFAKVNNAGAASYDGASTAWSSLRPYFLLS